MMTGQEITLSDLRLTKGPSPYLPRRAILAIVSVPSWKLLQSPGGRKQLVARLSAALMTDPGDTTWEAIEATAASPAKVFAAQLLAVTAIHLQNVASHPVSRFCVLPGDGNRDPVIAWEYLLPRTGEAAGFAAAELLTAIAGENSEAEQAVSPEFVGDLIKRVTSAVGNSVVEILLTAAYRRGISFHVIDPVFPVIAFGQGAATRRLMTSMSHSQGHISTLLTRDKLLALSILREAGFPVPSHIAVGSPEAAVQAAQQLGYPVVVKPVDLMRAKGVSVNLTSPQAVSEAFDTAFKVSRHIVVEEHLPGLPYRILVVDGRARAAMRRSVPMVVGDGSSDIAQLIEATNLERSRMLLQRSTAPRRLEIEEFKDELQVCLAEQGISMASVPAAGAEIQLAFMGRGGRGGENLDVTDRVHPDNLAMAEDAARIFETDPFGLDFMTDDISRSYKEGNCGINEVNSEPALSLHLTATRSPRDVVTPFFEMEFGPGGRGSIPILCCMEDSTAAGFTMVEKALAMAGLQAGIAAGADEARTGRFQLQKTSKLERPSERILADIRVDVALLSLTEEDLVRGLAFERCDAFFLPRASLTSAEPRLVDWTRLVAGELAETLVVKEEDDEFWSGQLNISGQRVIILSKDPASTDKNGTADREMLRLHSGDSINVYYHHGAHVDRLIALDRTDYDLDGMEDQLLLTVAALLILEHPPRDIGSLLCKVLVHRSDQTA